MFLERIEILKIDPCMADSGRLRARGKLSRDVTDVMPYLNAVLSNATYVPEGPSITLRQGPRLITLYSQHVVLIKAVNTTDVLETLDWIQGLINDTYQGRHSIEPDYATRIRPAPIEVLRLLPRRNCGLCGELSCVAFSLRVFTGERRLAECVPLLTSDPESALVLLEMLGEEPPGETHASTTD